MSKIKDPSKNKQKNKKLALHPAELVWYILCGAVGLWGLTYIVLGLVAQNLPITSEDNQFIAANNGFAKTFGLDWLGWGLIILAIAAVAVVIVLLIFSNKVDKDYEKKVRRAQRLAQLEQEEARLEEQQEQNIVDAEIAPVEEKPQEDEREEVVEEPVQEEPQEVEEKVEEPASEPVQEEQPEEKKAE